MHLSLPLLALPLLGAATALAQPFQAPSRRHHARLVERVNKRATLHTRADGKVCRIRPDNGTVAGTTKTASGVASASVSGVSSSSSIAPSSTIGGNAIAVSSSSSSAAPVATSSATSAAAAATSSAASSVGSTSGSGLTPNGIKAGIAGGDSYPWMKDHIGWWYDWSPNPAQQGAPVAVSMLWGDGGVGVVASGRCRAR